MFHIEYTARWNLASEAAQVVSWLLGRWLFVNSVKTVLFVASGAHRFEAPQIGPAVRFGKNERKIKE